MVKAQKFPPLKPLHSQSSLNNTKLATFEKLSTEILVASLAPRQQAGLKTREDGTILDGHHRITVLRNRGIAVDDLPRDVVLKDQKDG
jgi:hypothetical protein